MITKVRYKELDADGVRLFTITESINLPLLTEQEEFSGKEKTFQKDGKFYGTPVSMQIMKQEGDKFVPMGQPKGFMIEEKGGVYLVPAPIIRVPEDGDGFSDSILDVAIDTGDAVADDAKQIMDTIKDEADKFSPERTLGFSYKQLLVIGLVGLVVIKLSK